MKRRVAAAARSVFEEKKLANIPVGRGWRRGEHMHRCHMSTSRSKMHLICLSSLARFPTYRLRWLAAVLALLRTWVEISLDLTASRSPWRRWLAAPCLDSDHAQRRSRRERLRDRGGPLGRHGSVRLRKPRPLPLDVLYGARTSVPVRAATSGHENFIPCVRTLSHWRVRRVPLTVQ